MNELEWRASQRELRQALRESPTVYRPISPQPLASIIVVCWNSANVLGRCLDQLFAQDYANREIIVVDDGSDDATPRVLREASLRGELTLVRNARNRGCPSARNLGLDRARGEIVAFIDADGFATPNWLSALVAAFGDDPQVGGVASTVFFDDNPMVVNGAGGIVNRQGWAADLSMNESYENAQLASQALYPMGCGMALRREAHQRVGPFDDHMINYYDDVDYGTRLWRMGYRVVVAADAWLDHGFGGASDSARKRLLCERHRMRVVLKHSRAAALPAWAAREVRGLAVSSWAGRLRKLRSVAWNMRHLPSALSERWRMREAPAPPPELLDSSWGDGFPVGVPMRLHPAPQRARASVEAGEAEAEVQLLHGWFPVERLRERRLRWAATSAAVLVHLEKSAKLLRLDYMDAPIDIGAVDVRIRRIGSDDPLRVVWHTRLHWPHVADSVERHPLELAPGDYEVLFDAPRGWSDPPRETRCLAFALSSLGLEQSWEIPAGGLNPGTAEAVEQLLHGWFDAEDEPARSYRWATGRAAAAVRLPEEVGAGRLGYRLPPRSIGRLRVAIAPLGSSQEIWSTELAWRDSDWHEDSFALELPAGDYVVSFDCANTWSNPEGRDPAFGVETRSLGFAISSLSFVADGPR